MNIGFQPTATSNRPSDDIENDGFFPSLSLNYFANQYGVPTELSNEMLKQTVLISAAQVNQALTGLKNKAIANDGYNTLSDIPTEKIDNQNLLTLHYLQAVYNKAKAALVRKQISLARKQNAESEAKTGEILVHFYETQASAAIANIQGKRLIGVALI